MGIRANRVIAAGLALGTLAACNGEAPACQPGALALEGPCAIETGGLALVDVQAVGSHNSYKRAIPPAELALIAQASPEAGLALDYSHIPLADQLDMGLRQLELDVFHDPEGGRFGDPALARLTAGQDSAVVYDAAGMDAPGFKVLHTQDIDPRSHCASFVACLETIRAWSQDNPDHVPLLVLVNLKTGRLGIPGTVDALDFDAAAFDALDAELRSVFDPASLVTPDDVRAEAGTLREAVLAGNWPSLDTARGRLIFALDTGEANVATYLRGTASLEGLPMFVNSISPDAPHAAYFTMNDPVGEGDLIGRRVAAGFLVRTRADADTKEARTGDTARREAAFRSGAHYISTDYYRPRSEWSDYAVSLPGGAPARCNPVRRGADCAPLAGAR